MLEPASPAWYCPGFPIGDRQGMAYASIPCLRISGSIDGHPVTGEAWADHQWGGLSWFQSPHSSDRTMHMVHGWDWYAISLETGTHIMVLVHRDMADRSIQEQWSLILEDGRKVISRDFSLVQDGNWKSPRTGIMYPLSAEITLPNQQSKLIITPLAPDQEIPIPGPMRAVWEGAARVEGTYGDRPVSGTARI